LANLVLATTLETFAPLTFADPALAAGALCATARFADDFTKALDLALEALLDALLDLDDFNAFFGLVMDEFSAEK
jgi:hypothetical protein